MSAWMYDVIYAKPTVIKIDEEFVSWVYGQYAEKMMAINDERERRGLKSIPLVDYPGL